MGIQTFNAPGGVAVENKSVLSLILVDILVGILPVDGGIDVEVFSDFEFGFEGNVRKILLSRLARAKLVDGTGNYGFYVFPRLVACPAKFATPVKGEVQPSGLSTPVCP